MRPAGQKPNQAIWLAAGALLAAAWSAALMDDISGAAIFGQRGVATVVRCGQGKLKSICDARLVGAPRRDLDLELAGETLGADDSLRVRHRRGTAVPDSLTQRASFAAIAVSAGFLTTALLAGAIVSLVRRGRRIVWVLALAVPAFFVLSVLSAWSGVVTGLPMEPSQFNAPMPGGGGPS